MWHTKYILYVCCAKGQWDPRLLALWLDRIRWTKDRRDGRQREGTNTDTEFRVNPLLPTFLLYILVILTCVFVLIQYFEEFSFQVQILCMSMLTFIGCDLKRPHHRHDCNWWLAKNTLAQHICKNTVNVGTRFHIPGFSVSLLVAI